MKQNADFSRFSKRADANGIANGHSLASRLNGQANPTPGASGAPGNRFTEPSAGAKECSDAVPMRMPAWKRALDLTLIVLASPLLVPLMGLIAVAIRISSPGPALFRQDRIGFRGRRFTCFKFRTMVVDADPTLHQGHLRELLQSERPMVKMDNRGDPRVIPLGRLLRASGLDELPQIFNILRGEMSLVGPRPCLPYEFEQYLPWQMERFNTMPGLTGLWQVSGKNRTTFNEMIRLDIEYARNLSLWQDLKIIFKTVPALLAQIRDTRSSSRTAAPERPGGVIDAAPDAPVQGVRQIALRGLKHNYFARRY